MKKAIFLFAIVLFWMGGQAQENTENKTYRGHDYSYYYNQYLKASAQKKAGAVLTSIGAGFSVVGIILLADHNRGNDNTGYGLFYGGLISFNAGIALWISAGIKSNNIGNAMTKTRKDLKLSFGTTHNGTGFTLNF